LSKKILKHCAVILIMVLILMPKLGLVLYGTEEVNNLNNINSTDEINNSNNIVNTEENIEIKSTLINTDSINYIQANDIDTFKNYTELDDGNAYYIKLNSDLTIDEDIYIYGQKIIDGKNHTLYIQTANSDNGNIAMFYMAEESIVEIYNLNFIMEKEEPIEQVVIPVAHNAPAELKTLPRTGD